jgi:hypothetical protein
MSKIISVGLISSVDSGTVIMELMPEAERRGHKFTQIVFDQAELTSTREVFEQKNLLSFDVLYYRTGLGNVWARELELFLKDNNRIAINLDVVNHPYRNYKTQQILQAARTDVMMPKTIVGKNCNYENIKKVLGSKFIIKADRSSGGRDVHIIESGEEFTSLDNDCELNDYLYQEYLPHDHDFRIHLIDGKAIAAYKRVPVKGDFRTNVTIGGSMHSVTDEVKEVLYPAAEKVASLLGLNICAVDFLERSTDGAYFFMETNINPGWENSDTEATGVNMSSLVVDYFEQLAIRES